MIVDMGQLLALFMLLKYYHRESLITEQQTYDHNPLYDCMQASRSQTQAIAQEQHHSLQEHQ